MTRFVQLCAKEEGFGRAGRLPTRRNNPMDLRHSPHSSHAGIGPDDIGNIDTREHGYEDAERQARLWAARGLTLRQAIETDAPANENDTAAFLALLCAQLPAEPDTPMRDILRIPAIIE